MNPLQTRIVGAFALALTSALASAADYPAPKEGDWVARGFRFHTGEVMPDLRLHYRTIGNPSGDPVLILRGTGGSRGKFFQPPLPGGLFGSRQPPDARKHVIIRSDPSG